jgi:xylan 1,4-beta-xylosidase
MSYWTYSDLFEENGPPPTPFHGGFGLLNREGIRKASFFAYKYLNELGNEELENSDRSSWLCRQGNDFTALFWDASLPRQTTPNVIYFRELHPALPLPDVKLHITSLSPGAYRMEIHRTGFEANDAYSHYIAMGSPKTLTPPQLQQLQGDSADAPESTDPVTIGSDGVLDCAIPMRSNDVVFIKLLKQ